MAITTFALVTALSATALFLTALYRYLKKTLDGSVISCSCRNYSDDGQDEMCHGSFMDNLEDCSEKSEEFSSDENEEKDEGVVYERCRKPSLINSNDWTM